MKNQFLEEITLRGNVSDYYINEADIAEISGVLASKQKDNLIYSGLPGTGKSIDVALIANAVASTEINDLPATLQDVKTALDGKKFYSLDLNEVFAADTQDAIDRNLSSIVASLRNTQNAVVVIEDANQLVDGSAQSGFLNSLMDVLKETNNQAIMMVSNDDLGKRQAAVLEAHGDKSKIFSLINKEEPTDEQLKDIMAQTRQAAQDRYTNLELTQEADAEILKLTSKYKGQKFYASAQPDIALSLRDRVVGYVVANQGKIVREQIAELEEFLSEIEEAIFEADEKTNNSALSADQERVQAEIEALKSSLKEDSPAVKQLKAQREKLESSLEQSRRIFDETFERNAQMLRDQEIRKLEFNKNGKSEEEQKEIDAEIEAWSTKTVTIQDLRKARILDDTVARLENALAPQLKKLSDLNTQIEEQTAKERDPIVIDDIAVQYAFEAFSGIPVTGADAKRQEQLMNAESILEKRVIGQSEAVSELASTIRDVEIINDPSRKNPKGSYLFIGPSGVGKSEITRALAEFVNQDPSKEGLFTLNMGQLKTEAHVNELTGAPAGYAGFELGGKLTNAVQENPNVVVLFDEIEKGHEAVLDQFLSITDDENGMLRDNQGVETEFKDTFVIATSNIGSKHFLDKPYEEAVEAARADLEATLKPEILGRFTKIIFFKTLSEDSICQIADLVYGSTKKKLQETGIDIDIDTDAIKTLVKETYRPAFGARPTVKAVKAIRKQAVTILLEARKAKKVTAGEQVPVQISYNPKTKSFDAALDESKLQMSKSATLRQEADTITGEQEKPKKRRGLFASRQIRRV